MRGMFAGCQSLTALDLSSFNTANLVYMNEMFEDCQSLTALDLSNFVPMGMIRWMFYLSNFNEEYEGDVL